MKVILIYLTDAAVLCMIFLICCYLMQDRRRFRVERQFSAVKTLFDRWMALAALTEGCAEPTARYGKTRNVSKKYEAISEMSSLVWGRQSDEMHTLARQLLPFCRVYESLAADYNRHLTGKLRGPLMRFLGFRALPIIELSETKE